MTPPERKALRAALRLPYPAFPCLASKAPSCPSGFKAALTADSGLATLWARYPGELIGVPTGNASGFSVLDVDRGKGGSEWWLENKTRLPVTRMHRTRSGGLHVLFRHREGIGNTAKRIAQGIDTRGQGGYIVWWPAEGFEVRDAPLAQWPDWLAPAEPPRPMPYIKAWPRLAGTAYSMSVENKLRGLARYVAGSPSGQRNATVYWAACRMAELMNVGAVDPAFARDVLIEAAALSGLTQTEARRTVESALRRAA